jgi:hypothetical protein
VSDDFAGDLLKFGQGGVFFQAFTCLGLEGIKPDTCGSDDVDGNCFKEEVTDE